MATIHRGKVWGRCRQLFSAVCIVGALGCTASRPKVGTDTGAVPTEVQLQSWVGTYSGQIDHGRLYLATGPSWEQWVPKDRDPRTEQWLWNKGINVQLEIRFEANDNGGRLHLTFLQRDSTPVQPWGLRVRDLMGLPHTSMIEPQVVKFDVSASRDVVLMHGNKLAINWKEDIGQIYTEKVSRSIERSAELIFERANGFLEGSIKYQEKDQLPGEWRTDDKHEMVFKGFRKNEDVVGSR